MCINFTKDIHHQLRIDHWWSHLYMKSILSKFRNSHNSEAVPNAETSVIQLDLNPDSIFDKLHEAKRSAKNDIDKLIKSQRILDENCLNYYEFDNINIINDKKTNHQELLYCEAVPLKTISISKICRGKLKVWYHTSVNDHVCITATVPYEIIDVAVKITEHSDALNNENNEPEILHYLNNEPEFIRLFGYHIDLAKKKCIIVLEWCAGGDLFTYVEKTHIRPPPRGIITIPTALNHIKQIIRWLITAILKCHMRDICYSDLKLDNIMFLQPSDITSLKLIDFGASRFIHDHGKSIAYKFISTSIHYTPPEVVHKYYMPLTHDFLKSYQLIGDNLYKIDIWQIGIIAYTLLNGRFPFDSNLSEKKERYDSIFKQICTYRELTFTKNKDINGKPLCDAICRDFISKLLKFNPTHRISLQEALNHPWLQ